MGTNEQARLTESDESGGSEREGHVMNWDQIKGNWAQVKGKAREQWGDLNDNELDRIAGRKDQLIGVLQEKYGKAREAAERESEEWAATLKGE